MKKNLVAHRGIQYQCHAINRNGKRCSKPITHQIGNIGYCEVHHRIEIEMRLKK